MTKLQEQREWLRLDEAQLLLHCERAIFATNERLMGRMAATEPEMLRHERLKHVRAAIVFLEVLRIENEADQKSAGGPDHGPKETTADVALNYYELLDQVYKGELARDAETLQHAEHVSRRFLTVLLHFLVTPMSRPLRLYLRGTVLSELDGRKLRLVERAMGGRWLDSNVVGPVPDALPQPLSTEHDREYRAIEYARRYVLALLAVPNGESFLPPTT